MGRAIVRDPKVFLFDEPLSNLDAKLRVQMRGEIKELQQRLDTTTIYVTHDQIEAMTMADKIVVTHEGAIEQIGSPLELYDLPVNKFVAGFIGSPSMNFLKGTIRKGDPNTFELEKGGSFSLDEISEIIKRIEKDLAPSEIILQVGFQAEKYSFYYPGFIGLANAVLLSYYLCFFESDTLEVLYERVWCFSYDIYNFI